MTDGMGAPPVQALLDHGIDFGLGVDNVTEAPSDIFAQMRATISLQHATFFDLKLAGKAGLPNMMTTRSSIKQATIHGATAVGLGDVTGSLEPGKQADIIMLRTDRPNILPVNDPIGAVVWGMDTSNLDSVFVAGRALMSNGVLAGDVSRARSLADAAFRRVASSAGLLTDTTTGGGS
jgi:cytosine/adenosine deaminase-related metal-dependent hydrolase